MRRDTVQSGLTAGYLTDYIIMSVPALTVQEVPQEVPDYVRRGGSTTTQYVYST